MIDEIEKAAGALKRAATPQPQQAEPVAWKIGSGSKGCLYNTYKEARAHTDDWRRRGYACSEPIPLYTQPDTEALRLLTCGHFVESTDCLRCKLNAARGIIGQMLQAFLSKDEASQPKAIADAEAYLAQQERK